MKMKKMRRGLSFCLVLLIVGLGPLNTWAISNKDEMIPLEKAGSNQSEIVTKLDLETEPQDNQGVSDQIVIVYKENTQSLKTLALETDLIKETESLSDRVDIIELNNPQAIEQTISDLMENPNILAAERNGILQTSELPNDPYIKDGSAWYFEKIAADKTWNQVSQSQQVVVAVIDTGLNTNHPDLQNRILEGYDFIEGSKTMIDLSGHGTKVSGCVAAVVNNGVGIAGVAGLANVKIRPYRTGGMKQGDRNLYISHIAAAIMKAADQEDVRIINMSFGTYSQYDSIRESIVYAASRGKVLVSSAGNEGNTSKAGQYGYPASYDEVISVAATNQYDKRPSFSQYNDQVDLVAPGDLILSTTNSGGYDLGSGTSFSAPIVSGACAFLLAVKKDLSVEEVQEALEATALDLGSPGRDPYHGYGRIQLQQAVDFVSEPRPLTGISLNPDQINLLKGNSISLKVDYAPENTTDDRSVFWSSSNTDVAEIDDSGKISALAIGETIILAKVGIFEANCHVRVKEISQPVTIDYQTHIQNLGWQEWKSDGKISGSTGKSLRLEGIRIEMEELDLGVRYRTHIQDKGWETKWQADGSLSGTVGEAKRLEGIYIELTGVDAELWDIYYQVHAQNLGWLDWAKNGQPAGSEGLSLRLEAIKIKVVPKNDPPPGATEKPFVK